MAWIIPHTNLQATLRVIFWPYYMMWNILAQVFEGTLMSNGVGKLACGISCYPLACTLTQHHQHTFCKGVRVPDLPMILHTFSRFPDLATDMSSQIDLALVRHSTFPVNRLDFVGPTGFASPDWLLSPECCMTIFSMNDELVGNGFI